MGNAHAVDPADRTAMIAQLRSAAEEWEAQAGPAHMLGETPLTAASEYFPELHAKAGGGA
jgi:hypothetical protein